MELQRAGMKGRLEPGDELAAELTAKHFRDGTLAHERIYWNQTSVLKQIGLLTDPSLPVFGIETAQKLLNPAM